jgi:hypothetical protein
MTRQLVKLTSIDYDMFDLIRLGDTFESAAQRILDLGRDVRSRYHDAADIRFQVEHYGYDGGVQISLNLYREETDQEYVDRVAVEEKAATLAKAKAKVKGDKEYAKYLELKAKFE